MTDFILNNFEAVAGAILALVVPSWYGLEEVWNDNQILVNNRGAGSSKSYSYTGSIVLKGSAYTYTNGVIAQRTVTFDELFTVV